MLARIARLASPARLPAAEIELGTRQIFILPNWNGLLFTLVLLALALVAVNYNNALAYLLTFLLASMTVVSLLHAQRNLLHLRLTVVAGDAVFAGEPASFRVCLHNDRNARQAVRLESAFGVSAAFEIPAHDSHWFTLSAPTRQRGWLDCPPFSLASPYPLGITRAWSRRAYLSSRCLVYPKPAVAAARRSIAGTDGESRPGSFHEGEDFTGLRAYRPGDTAARISWKTLARGQGLYTKEFLAPQAEHIWLDWAALAPQDTETRLSALCRAVLEADEAGLTYGLRLPQVTFEPDSGVQHRQRCLEALALHEDRR